LFRVVQLQFWVPRPQIMFWIRKAEICKLREKISFSSEPTSRPIKSALRILIYRRFLNQSRILIHPQSSTSSQVAAIQESLPSLLDLTLLLWRIPNNSKCLFRWWLFLLVEKTNHLINRVCLNYRRENMLRRTLYQSYTAYILKLQITSDHIITRTRRLAIQIILQSTQDILRSLMFLNRDLQQLLAQARLSRCPSSLIVKISSQFYNSTINMIS
jgi:hypothetical protein